MKKIRIDVKSLDDLVRKKTLKRITKELKDELYLKKAYISSVSKMDGFALSANLKGLEGQRHHFYENLTDGAIRGVENTCLEIVVHELYFGGLYFSIEDDKKTLNKIKEKLVRGIRSYFSQRIKDPSSFTKFLKSGEGGLAYVHYCQILKNCLNISIYSKEPKEGLIGI